MLAAKLLAGVLRDASIIVVDHLGVAHHCGPAHVTPSICVRVHDAATAWHLLFSPQIAFGEGYVSGAITIEKGSLRDLMRLAAHEQYLWHQTASPLLRQASSLWAAFRNRLDQINSKTRSKRNVEQHYDIGNEVFELFLDPAMQYTCAYFPDEAVVVGCEAVEQHLREDRTLDLDHAQQRRMNHMIAKLGLKSGMRVLDVGCGWGGFAIELARQCNVIVHGISLSREQIKYAEDKVRRAGLSSRITFELVDYRDLKGRFDRIVAAGILEHIGRPNFLTFFRTLNGLLAPDGVILIDATGRVDGPGGTNPWIRKHIYPGGYIPALSEVQRAVERSGLELYDAEVFRMHYALTAREWERRFTRSASEIAAIKGQAFVRKWQLYLAASEMSFIYGRFINFQLQMSNSRFATPSTRAYLENHVRPVAHSSHLAAE